MCVCVCVYIIIIRLTVPTHTIYCILFTIDILHVYHNTLLHGGGSERKRCVHTRHKRPTINILCLRKT